MSTEISCFEHQEGSRERIGPFILSTQVVIGVGSSTVMATILVSHLGEVVRGETLSSHLVRGP